MIISGVGASTIAKAYRLLRAVLNTAADDDVIVRNPCRIKGARVGSTPERPVVGLAEVLALAAAVPPQYRVLVLLAVFGSMRWGELMGLRRSDIDLENASVSIERSVAEVGTDRIIKETKTAAGVRSVALPTWLVPELSTTWTPSPSQVRRSGVRRYATAAELRHGLEAGQGRSRGGGGACGPR